jgi:hypothetical protein
MQEGGRGVDLQALDDSALHLLLALSPDNAPQIEAPAQVHEQRDEQRGPGHAQDRHVLESVRIV